MNWTIILMIIGLAIIVAGLTFAVLWVKDEKKKIKELNEKAKADCDHIYKRIANINLETDRKIKQTKRHVRQYVRSKTKKAMKDQKSGKPNLKGK